MWGCGGVSSAVTGPGEQSQRPGDRGAFKVEGGPIPPPAFRVLEKARVDSPLEPPA